MKRLPLFALFCLIFFAVACVPATPQASTPPVVPTAARTATVTLRPTNTPTSVQETATEVLPTPTDMPYPVPVEITPIPEPINQTGPWLMLHPDIFYTGPYRIIGPVFVNADGSGWEPATLPHDPHSPPDELDWWFGSVSPAGPFAAFQDYFSEYHPMCSQCSTSCFSGYVDTLYILKLPENEVVRQFSMFGPKSLEQISEEECELVAQGSYDIPPVLGVVQNSYSLRWSPDGRYLAFPAAPEAPHADLYLYDTVTNEIRRLTTRQNNPDILGWSPDGQTIIYRGITKMSYSNTQVLESDGLYSVTLSGNDRLIFESADTPGNLQWLSQSQFLVIEGACDDWGSGVCAINLLLVDLSTGNQEVLYNNPKGSISYASDPIHHVILVTNPPSDMPGLAGMESVPHHYLPDLFIVPGIFKFDLTTRSLCPVLLEGPSEVYWVPADEAFKALVTDTNSPESKHRTMIRFQQDGSFSLEKVDEVRNISPDGNWSVGEVGEDWYILDTQNMPVQKLLNKSTSGWSSYNWSPDSSVYVQLISDDQMTMYELVVYRKENNWQPEFIRKIQYGRMWSFEWITP